MDLRIYPPEKACADIVLPMSKSITNRALVIAALCGNVPRVISPALCDDTVAVMNALDTADEVIDVGPAGTAMRFLTAYFATCRGRVVTLDGNERMRQRPIAPLVDALRQMGADIDYLGQVGYPPLRIAGTVLHGGHVEMDGSVSSQFASAVMMILSVAGGGTLHLHGDIVSAPYIRLTADVMRQMGGRVTLLDDEIVVGEGYAGGDCVVETDWSAAAPWYALAALMPASTFTLRGLTGRSLQGDARLADMASQLGIVSRFDAQGVTLDTSHFIGCCCSCFVDMAATPDLVLSWAVLMCLLERSFRMTGVRTLRHKESDRLEAMQQELSKLGYVLKIDSEDAISWYGERVAPAMLPPVIDTHGDHRMAMAFAPAAVRFPGLVIGDAGVVDKSYPAFWRHLEQAGFTITGLAQ